MKALCAYLLDRYGISFRHIIAANEGNAAALTAGYRLATGKVPVVYLQNSGLGNIIKVMSRIGPVDKSQIGEETIGFLPQFGYMVENKSDIYHSFKV